MANGTYIYDLLMADYLSDNQNTFKNWNLTNNNAEIRLSWSKHLMILLRRP
jgi:hypothetical protein